MTWRLMKILFAFMAGFALYGAAENTAPVETEEANPLPHMAVPPLSPESEGITQVEPIVMIGSLEVFDMDFTTAIEAMSIASFDDTPLYPILAGSANGSLSIWWENKTALQIIEQHDWSQIIIAESDAAARDITSFEDNIYNYAQLAKQINRKLVLLQGGDFITHPLESFASRQDKLLNNYVTLHKVSQIDIIPLAHLLARLQIEHGINIFDNDKRITLEGAWAAAAISYMGLMRKRPANPNFSRLYPDLQQAMEPFASLEIEQRFDIIDAAWKEWQGFQRLVL